MAGITLCDPSLTRVIPVLPECARDECQLIIRRYTNLWFTLLYINTSKKFLEIVWKMLRSGAFPEADGNVWRAPSGQAETYYTISCTSVHS